MPSLDKIWHKIRPFRPVNKRTVIGVSKDYKSEDDALEAKLNDLPSQEAEVLRSQIKVGNDKVKFLSLFKYATNWDVVVILVGVFFSAIHGVALPMFTLVVGEITGIYNSFFALSNIDRDEFKHEADHNALYFVYIGVASLVASATGSFLMVNRGEVLAARWRRAYIAAVLRQNIGYFDRLGSGEVPTRITNDTMAIQEAISEKLANIVQGLATFITAIVISLSRQWKLACILFGTVAFVFSSMAIGSRIMVKYTVRSDRIYSQGSAIAEEALSAVRSTIAFAAQDRLVAKFGHMLKLSLNESRKASLAQAIMLGCIWSSMFFNYALSYWQGSRIIASRESSVGHVVSVVMAMMIGSFQFGLIAPNVRFIARGIASAKAISETINRKPVLDSSCSDGIIPSEVIGRITLSHVRFRYPSRPDVLVLPDFSLQINEGETVALVGTSGSGKSTLVNILERFYLPLSGSVKLDGVELSDLNLRWLRQQIGLVQEEPTLFSDTIYENISQGFIGTTMENENADFKHARVMEACKMANAYDFIQTLTDGFNTNVGDRGFLLSGGQKQRIATARAIVSNPKILLLDEATSALDTKSEGIVQEALERAAKSRTTIVIAHLLSAIKDADKIVVMSRGEIVEEGRHHDLLSQNGYYKQLVAAQQMVQLDAQEGEEELVIEKNKLEIQEDVMLNEESTQLLETESWRTEGDDIPGIKDPEHGSTRRYISLLWQLNSSEHLHNIAGAISAAVLGYCYPSLATITGRTLGAIIVPPSQYDYMRHEVNVLTAWFFFVGCIAFIASFSLVFFLSYGTDQLVRKVRLSLFRQMLRMDVAFYDHNYNTPGALTSVLAKEAKAIDGLGGATMGQILQSIITLVGGIATGIPYSWQIGLVALATIPVLLCCGFLRVWVIVRFQQRARRAYESSGSLASEYASAVRTVQSLANEHAVVNKYSTEVDSVISASFRTNIYSSILYGLSQGLMPWCIALIFWWGSTMLREGKANVHSYYVVFMAMVLGSQSAGRMFSHSPDIGKARQAGANIYRILTSQPIIDPYSSGGIIPAHESVKGDIHFHNVQFSYPTRPQVPVLRGLNLEVKHGQYIALVGASGCGKSTTIGLIERFYNPQSGQIYFDGKNISTYNLTFLRNQMALVQQEPMLYSGTIRENITMGLDVYENEISQEQVEQVCRRTNMHEFIMSLPDGYNTSVGSRGSLLSGGQKQRIAIARALIRDPKILLLDEATSALDSESERAVQMALDEATRGRTTIAVAHRLSTIQFADIIYVLDKGAVVEQGDHKTLLAKNKRYAELVRLQGLGP